MVETQIVSRPRMRRLALIAFFGAVGLSLYFLPPAHEPWATAYCAPPASAPQAPPLPDPLPLRRLLVSPERIPFELQRARQKALVHMTRDEFEARVADAARAALAVNNPPRLVEARYRASLLDTGLVGTAQWSVVNPGAGPGILPLQPLNLALRQVQVNNRDAILGDLQGKSPGLLIEGPGPCAVSVGWSARGEPGPAGLRFELKVPSCVLTTFELELPADRTATLLGDSGLLSGPQASSREHQRIWRLLYGSAPSIDLLIRPALVATETKPLVLTRLRTEQRLTTPYLVEADYDFNLEILHGGVRELWCEGDPALHPTSVNVGGAEIDTWEVRPGPTPASPFRLRIQLAQRFQGDLLSLRVHCLAPVEPRKRWTSPALRLTDAVSQGETLSLQLPADVQLDDWQPGNFGLAKATAEPNGGQVLTLESGLGVDAGRPSARLRAQEPAYRARQLAWWQIGTDSTSVTALIDYEVVRGRLFRLPVLLPTNWTIDRVELTPPDLLKNWITLPGGPGQTILIIELQRPLESPTTPRLVLQLRPANPWPIPSSANKANRSEFSQSFPEIVPQGTRVWDGALAIHIDPLYEATVRASSAVVSDKSLEDRGLKTANEEEPRFSALDPLASILNSYHSPWGAQPPDYLYTFRGQGVSGTLKLRPRSLRVRARCTSEIALASGRAAVLTRLLLQPDIGNPETIDVLVSAPVAGPWNWRSEGGRNAVKGMQRLTTVEILPHLLPLGAGTALSALTLFHPLFSRASWWRLTLAQPLREPLLLETTFDLVRTGLPADAATGLSPLAGTTLLESLALAAAGSDARIHGPEGRRWEVPLLGVVSAQPMDGEVHLYLAAAGIDKIEPIGLGEIATASGAGDSIPWRTFRYSRLPVSLVLHGRTAAPDLRMAAWAERAHLTTYVEPDGRLLNYYSFQVRNWKQGTLPLRLPAGARLLAAKVEGRWLPRPRLAETTADTTVAQLPVAMDSPTHHFEVLYALAYPAGTLWTEVRAPAPVLPVGVVAFRRTWCLPPGLMPWRGGAFQRHPGAHVDFEAGDIVKAMSLPLLVDASVSLASEDWRRRQERQLAEAQTHLRARQADNEPWSLGDVLHYLTYEFLNGQEVVVIDAVALREAGLRPATPIRARYRNGPSASLAGESSLRFPENLGLIWMPCRPAPLLTTQRQWIAWQGALGRTGSVPDAVEAAISEAIADGHDRSGRFRSAADWLRECGTDWEAQYEGEGGRGGQSVRPGPFAFLPHPESWTEWQPVAGQPDEERIVVLRQDSLWGLAYSLSGMLLLAWWWAQHHWKRLAYGLTLFWLAASVLGLLWLPAALRAMFWWPMLAGIVLAAAWYLVSALRSRAAAPTGLGAAAASVLALVLAVGLPGQAAPGPYIVWLLPGPAESPEKLHALVPPEVLTQLRTMARRGAAGLEGAFLLDAKYQGRVANGAADLQAEFQIHCFTEERTTLTLPLGGIELREALLDGSTAYAEALAPPQNGYGVKIQGRGAHTLKIRFSVRIPASTGEAQDLRFTIPELARSQLSFVAPEGACYLQAVVGRGAQHITPDPMGVRLDADLGRVATFHVHWRQESARPASTTAEVKEVYYWDAQRSGSRLLALLNYTINSGAVTELAVHLPDDMEVRQVELIAPGSGGLGPRLKEWSRFGPGGERRLRLQFQAPVTSSVQILLELVPRLPLTQSAAVSLPVPEGVSFSDGFLAYRVKGLQSSVADLRALMGIEPADFEPHWQPAGTEYPGLPERAYRFHRTSKSAPFLRLDLRAPASRIECLQDLTWRLSPQQADLHARVKLTAPQKDLVYVEWEIPADVVVADVRGADVRSWSRTASRLHIWFQRSVAETALELMGWMVRPTDKPQESFQLPCLAFPGAVPHVTFVRLVAEKSWTLHGDRLVNLAALPEPRPVDNDQSYLSNHAVYRGRFQLRPDVPRADLQILSLVEVRDRRVVFNATIDYDLGQGKSRTLTVRLRNWKGPEPRLEGPATVGRSQPRRDPLARTWTLEPKRATDGHVQCQLTGTLAVDSNAEIVVPEVSVDEAASSERWLAVVGQGLQPEEQRGLVASNDPASFPGRWPAAAGRLRQLGGSIWRIDAPDWKLRLRTDFPLVESRPAQLLLDEQAAAIVDGRRWLHQATYWLYQESGTHLGVLLPDGASLMMAALDGSEVTPLQAGSELWLPLAGGGGLRLLQLYWIFYADREQVDFPRLQKPRLENILPLPAEQRLPTVWTLHIPPGYRLAYAGENTLPGNRVERFVQRASAQFLLTGLLTQHAAGKIEDSPGRQLLSAQEHFYRSYREAEHELACCQGSREGLADLDSLAIRLQKLEADNKQLSQTHHFEGIRRQAEENASHPDRRISHEGISSEHSTEVVGDLLAEQGTPTYWQTSDDGGAPRLHVIAERFEQVRHALAYSGLLLIFIVVAWILPSYPRAVAWLWASWPEQMVVLGGLGWLLRGESLLFALLIFLGAAARLIYLGRWLVLLLRRPPQSATRSGSASAT